MWFRCLSLSFSAGDWYWRRGPLAMLPLIIHQTPSACGIAIANWNRTYCFLLECVIVEFALTSGFYVRVPMFDYPLFGRDREVALTVVSCRWLSFSFFACDWYRRHTSRVIFTFNHFPHITPPSVSCSAIAIWNRMYCCLLDSPLFGRERDGALAVASCH